MLIFESSHINEAAKQVKLHVSDGDPNGHEWLYDHYPKPNGKRRRSSTGFVQIDYVDYPIKPIARFANHLAGHPMKKKPTTDEFRSYFRRIGFLVIGESLGESEKHTKRQRKLAERLSRKGQAKFRKILMTIFRNTCVVSNCNIPEAVQAAHIVTKKGHDINEISNGIILRSDLHLLFDANLMTIDPLDFVVSFDEGSAEYYREFHGASILKNLKNHPAIGALSNNLKARN